MAKYFSFYIAGFSISNGGQFSVYYDEINESKYAKMAYTNVLVKNYQTGSLVGIMNVEVPDTATSVIIKGSETKTFPLVSTPPTVGTLFLTFDTID